MTAIKVADLFGDVGFKVDFSQLDRFQQRLSQAKQQLLALQAVTSRSLIQSTNVGAVRQLNTALAQTLALTQQIAAQGGVRVRAAGVPGQGAANARQRGRGPGQTGGASAGLMSGLGFGRASPLARNFLGGFTTALAVRSLFEAQVGLDTIRVGLQAIVKPGEDVGETMKFLRDQADKLGFEFATSATEFTKLAASANAAGISTQQTRDIFIAAQEAARVFHLSVADTEGVLKAFTQILSKGKVEAQELRNQLGNRLPGAFAMMAKALGMTTAQLDVAMKQGKILATDALPKLAKVMHDTYAGTVLDASHTAQAELNRFKNAWFDFRVQLSKAGVDNVFALALEGGINALKILTPLLHAVGFAFRALITPIHALGRILKNFFDAMPNAIIVVGALTAAIAILAKTQLMAIAPWVLGGLAIAALLILIDDLATALHGGESAIGDLAASGDGLVSVLANILLFFGQMVQTMAEAFAAWQSGGSVFDALADGARKLQDFLIGILDNLAKIADWVFGGRLGKIGEFLGGKAADVMDFAAGVPGQISTAADSVTKSMKNFVFGGNQITIQAGPGSDPQEIARLVEQKMQEHTDTQMRQAQAQFGVVE